jgi:3',5'-nucleoside bisphosphate phosphatase
MKPTRIDLHVHSTASDGARGPADIVSRARAGGLDTIALADHDTTAGIAEALAAAGAEVKVVPAIEISAAHAGRDLHVLGYFIDPDAPPLTRYVAHAKGIREERIREMIERLAALDVDVDFAAVIAEAGPHAASLARPHLARALHAAGHVATISEAFTRFIGDEGPAYVAARLLDVAGAIELIHEAGGLAVWAHPPVTLIEPLLPAFVEAGLDGVECYRPRLPEGDLQKLLHQVRRHRLVATGGSDWHGDWHGPLGSFYLHRHQVEDFLELGGA